MVLNVRRIRIIEEVTDEERLLDMSMEWLARWQAASGFRRQIARSAALARRRAREPLRHPARSGPGNQQSRVCRLRLGARPDQGLLERRPIQTGERNHRQQVALLNARGARWTELRHAVLYDRERVDLDAARFGGG